MEKLNLILFPNCEYMMVKGRYSNSWISTFGLRVFLYIYPARGIPMDETMAAQEIMSESVSN